MYTPTADHINHILLFEFHKGNTANLAAKTLKYTYGNVAVNKKICRRWFSFSKWVTKIQSKRRTESRMFNSEQLVAAIDENPICTT